MSDLLFQPFTLGRRTLKNRVVMAPMTRSRSPGNVPSELVATYYAQRADAGLIITEGTSPSPDGLGYSSIPGLFSAEQAAAWRRVTDAVHAKGGAIFVQLMHSGRVGHPANLPAGAKVRGPSALAAPGAMFTIAEGMMPHPVPEEMSEADIERALAEYEASAALAIEAGFDGVELHGANGYLIDQFLNRASNQRTDRWGGTIEGRTRFALEAARRVAARIGADRVGFRVSPYGVFNGMSAEGDAEHEALFTHLATALGALGLAYVHVVDHSPMGAPEVPQRVKTAIREAFRGTYILSGGYDAKRAEVDLVERRGDLVAFGRPFISNPDLVTKLKTGAALTPPNPATFYTPGAEGYTDYPAA
ncbi:alkene reductase [Myxococcota bacterium]|nr:alkene reductase [Myxococcota bacterium]